MLSQHLLTQLDGDCRLADSLGVDFSGPKQSAGDLGRIVAERLDIAIGLRGLGKLRKLLSCWASRNAARPQSSLARSEAGARRRPDTSR